MTLSELAPYVAMGITIAVWLMTQSANRRHEIFKERLKRRVDMFDGLMPAIGKFLSAVSGYNSENSENDAQECQNALDVLGQYRIKMVCYGDETECQAFEELMRVIEDRDMARFAEKNNFLVDLIKKNLRRELGAN